MDLVIMKNRQAVTTSLQVADSFNRNHRDVLRSIDGMKDVRNFAHMFSETNVPDSYGRPRRAYYMNRDGFTLLAMGFTGQDAMNFKLDYIDAFNRMEQQTNLAMTPEEKLELVMETGNRANNRLTHVEGRLTDLEKNQKLDPGEYNWLGRRINRAVRDYMDMHHLKLTNPQRSKLFHDINSGVCTVAHVRTRTQIREGYFDDVSDYISDWVPSTATLAVIKQMGSDLPVAQEA